MKLTITSASGTILSAHDFLRISMMTENGQITILSRHEPIISVIRPGALYVDYYIGWKVHHAEYATGGWVLHVSWEETTILIDTIMSENSLTDISYIEAQKQEAESLMREYIKEHGEYIDPQKLIELEYDLLKYTAMHNLGQKFQDVRGHK